MPKSRPSPARSQGAPVTPRRQKPRTRSVGSPARSNASGRLSTVIDQFKEINKDSFALSPLGKTVLNDETDIEQPRRASWWKRVDNSRVVSEILDTDKGAVNNVFDELDIEVLSQEKKDHTMDLPESSDSESISSIVIPQRRLFSQKENLQQNRYKEIVKTRESLTKQNKTNIADKTATETGPRNLFNKAPKRTKPIFPAALLNFSPDKTANKTKELPAEVKGEARNLFGNRPGTKRKNMFADFILSESEDDISEIQPKLFAFQKNSAPVRHSTARPRESSPTSSITTDIEMDDWHLLPSSTMVEQQIEAVVGTTPGKRTRLSKLSEAKESTVANSTANTKHSNKSASKNHGNDNLNEIAKEKTNVSLGLPKAQVDVVTEDHKKQHDNNDTSEVNSNKSKAINKYVEETPEATQEATQEENNPDENSEEMQSIQEKLEKNNQDIDQDIIDAKVHEEMELSEHEEERNDQAADKSENEIETNQKHVDKNYENKKNFEEIETGEHVVGERMEDNEREVDEQEMAEQKIKDHKNQNDKQEMVEQAIEDQEIEDNEQEMAEQAIEDKEIEDDEQEMAEQAIEEQDLEDDEQEMAEHAIENQEIEDDEQEIAEQSIEDQDIEDDDHKVDEEEIPFDDSETNDNEEEADKEQTGVSEQEIEDEQVEEMVLQMEDEDEIENDDNEIEQELSDNEDQNESQEVQDENQEEENNSQIIHDQSASNGLNVKNDEDDEEIDSDNEEEIQNESQNIQNERHESDDDQVENDDDEQEAEEQGVSDEEQDESQELLNESQEQEIENTSHEIEEESDQDNDTDIQNESAEVEEQNDEEIQNESQAEINNESQEINDDQEEIQNESQDVSDGAQEDNEEDDQEGSEQDDQADIEDDQGEGEQETRETESETPNVSHDTTGRHRKKDLKSPEAILHEVTNQTNSFTTKGRNTSIRKTKSIFKIKHSLAPVTESTRLSDGTKNSSAEGSGWDSHRTTRKTLRQTFGRDFTPRKSLRAMVMEKSAKRQTAINEANAALNLQEAADDVSPEEAQEEMDYDDNIDNVENNQESDHEVSKRTRQTTLEMYLQKIKKENIERKLKIEEQVKNSLKFNPHRRDFLNRIPPKPIRRTTKPLQIAPKKRQKPSVISLEDLPPEFVEDMKYKPPKRYQPSNASWITKRLYKFLESKLEPTYDYKARVRAEKLVEMIYNFARDARRERVAAPHAVAELKREMARLHVVQTHFDFYNFFHDYMPLEVKIKVVPDIVNDIPLPRNGVFGDIMDAQ